MAICDQFPSGLRVLVVDDDTSCLIILEKMLLRLMYQVTICSQAEVALTLLREKKGFFDLVLSDVHMPGMNGYKLLQQVGLEMDLPVIMMSVDGRTSTVMTGINNGACDYLIKPIRSEELKNIWQHVVRKNCILNKSVNRRNSLALEGNKNSSSSVETVYSVSECSEGSLKVRKKKKKKKRNVDGDENEDDEVGNNSKKSRVVWSIELHQQFVNAVNQLGIDKAVPKRILELMNAPSLSRENVASHLQKFRLYMKRLSGGVVDSQSSDSENIQALVSSGQIHPQTFAALYGRPISNHHMYGGFGVCDNNENFSMIDVSSYGSNRGFGAVRGLSSSSANLRQQCDDFNNNEEYRIKQGINGSNVDEESWILERSLRQRKNLC